jgi:integrase
MNAALNEEEQQHQRDHGDSGDACYRPWPWLQSGTPCGGRRNGGFDLVRSSVTRGSYSVVHAAGRSTPPIWWNRDHTPRLERLGLPRTRIHDLRHFHGTALVASGVDARTVADRLGHSSVSFMLQTYAHAVATAQEHAASVANDC